ncbi:PQQ-binding-like beta-propeller repeat protein [Streptomyces sp. MAR4 CNX-425]|uniref:outer membrane protein assembly factor BamB family protein n=1 Tax=Streptomyces sp. MAR4 CNX-425 TaxID=3406343 RepID=UPI003B508989
MADEYGQNGQAGGGFGPPPPNGPGVPPGTPAPPPGPPPAAPPPAAFPPEAPPPGMPQPPPAGGYVPQQPPMGAPVPPGQGAGPHPRYPAPPPPRSGGGAKAVGIVLSVLLVVAVLGGGAAVVLLSGDDDGGSSSTAGDELPSNALEQLWSTPLEGTHIASGDSASLPGLWPVGGHIVHGDEAGGLRAYDARSGDEKWRTKKPKHAGELCAMSRTTSPGGIGAVAFDAGGDDCAYLAAVEVDTGTLLWDQNLAGDVGNSNPVLTVNDETISTNIGMYVNNWTAKGGAPGMDFTSRGQDCDSTLVLGDDYAVGSSECTDVSPRHQLSVLDTRGGTDPWRFPGVELRAQRVLGENPLTVLLQDDEENEFVQSFSDDGKQGKRIALTGELRKLQFEADYTFVTEDGVLVTEYGDNVHFAAVDLKSGELLWKTPKRPSLKVIGYDPTDGRLMAVAQSDDGLYLELTEYAVRSGDTEVIGALAVEGQSMGSPSTATWAWDGSTVYMAASDDRGRAVLRAFRGTA